MDPDRIRAQLERMLVSPAFAESERARKFLRFVVEQTLNGKSQIVKETVIAIEVLGRSSSFDSRTDPIVRVEAGRLRGRLSTYYGSVGKDDAIVISMPKGGYVPEFAERTPDPGSSARDSRLIWILAALLACGLVLGIVFYTRSHLRMPAERSLFLSLLPPGSGPVQASAISPDGHHIVFAADGGLWIRPIDRQESHVLLGTNGASNPFWSPDSHSVGFFTPAKLKRVEISGGPPREICDAAVGRGGSWGLSNVIVFAPHPGGGLFRVDAQGGKPTPITLPDLSHGEVSHLFPYFLPDGRRFLYSVVSRTADSSIRVASLDNERSKFLTNGEPGAIYAGNFDGAASLIFVYRGELFAQPVTTGGLEPHGEPSVIASSVRLDADRANASISTGGVLTFEPGRTKDQQLTWFDRDGRTLGIVGPRNSYLTWTLSPDEKHVAIQDELSGSDRQPSLWILETERGSLSRIATHGAQSFSPVWSPDGSEVLFSDGTHDAMRLVRQRLDNTVPVSVLESQGIKVPSDWSTDGKFVAYFTSWPDFKRLSFWVASVSPSRPESPRSFESSSGNEFGATFSPAVLPGGPRWIAYCSNETGRREVYVADFPAGLHKWMVSSGGGATPHWRRDGRELFYIASNSTLMSVEVTSGGGSFHPGHPQPLFDTGINSRAMSYRGLPVNTYAVSRDGRRILVNRIVEPETPSVTVLIRR